MEGALLMGDKAGEKYSVQYGGLYKRTTTVNVHRGELLITIPGSEIITRNDGQRPHNYRVKKDQTISLYCSEQEVSPLGNYEFLLLETVSSNNIRFSMFLTGNVLDWGQTLKPGSDVFVTVPGVTTQKEVT